MKIVITITASEISTLIQQHLAKEGMKVNVEDIKYSKGSAVVTADAPMDIKADVPNSVEEITSVTDHVAVRPPPQLEAIDGGNAPLDIDAIRRASDKAAASNPGKFPLPERQLMEGESFDFPGDKR